MFFLGLIVFVLSAKFLPWFAIGVIGFVAGLATESLSRHVSFALAAGVSHAALAYYADGRHFGIVSQRMSGLFSLPNSALIFAVVFALSAITVFLWSRAGQAARHLVRTFTV